MFRRFISDKFFGVVDKFNKSYNKNYFNSSNIFMSLNKDSNEFTNNIKWLEQIEFTIYGPGYLEKFKVLKKEMFEATVQFNKDNMRINKTFKSNNYDDLMNKIRDYLNGQVKL